MKKEIIPFSYEIFDAIQALPEADQELLKTAREITHQAYAPYSKFYVGAAARLQNGKIVTGTNQENASSPAGLCAERVVLATAASLFKNIPLVTIAISYYNNNNGKSGRPAAPCGICRQSLLECEVHHQHPIRLLLSGMEGEVFAISNVKSLLPLSFSGADLK